MKTKDSDSDEWVEAILEHQKAKKFKDSFFSKKKKQWIIFVLNKKPIEEDVGAYKDKIGGENTLWEEQLKRYKVQGVFSGKKIKIKRSTDENGNVVIKRLYEDGSYIKCYWIGGDKSKYAIQLVPIFLNLKEESEMGKKKKSEKVKKSLPPVPKSTKKGKKGKKGKKDVTKVSKIKEKKKTTVDPDELRVPKFKNAKVKREDVARVFSRYYSRDLPERIMALNLLIEGGKLNDMAKKMSKHDFSARFKNLNQPDITNNVQACRQKIWRMYNYILAHETAEFKISGDEDNPNLQMTKIIK